MRLFTIGLLLLLLGGCGSITKLLPWSDTHPADQSTAAPNNVDGGVDGAVGSPPSIVWQHNLDYTPLGGAK
ncbi:MAG: hypothetical protein Q9M13_02450, partial [Mariprofundales bacterium]|nr:hypothetical protein [Mariprofundales bacterium]